MESEGKREVDVPNLEKCTIEEEIPPLQILGKDPFDKEKDKIMKVFLNRLPNFSDFVWEKFDEIDPSIDAHAWDSSPKKFFWVVGTNAELNIQILYWVLEAEPKPAHMMTELKMKDGSMLLLDHHDLHLDIGATKNWIGERIPCIAEDPIDQEMVCNFYLL